MEPLLLNFSFEKTLITFSPIPHAEITETDPLKPHPSKKQNGFHCKYKTLKCKRLINMYRMGEFSSPVFRKRMYGRQPLPKVLLPRYSRPES